MGPPFPPHSSGLHLILLFNPVLMLNLLTKLLPNLVSIPRELVKGGFSPSPIPYPSLCLLGESGKHLEGLQRCQGWEQDLDFWPLDEP